MPQLTSLVAMVVLMPPLIEVTLVQIPLLMSLMAMVVLVHSLMGLTSAMIPVFLLQGFVAMVLLIPLVPLQMSLMSMVNLVPLLKCLMVPMGVVTLLMSCADEYQAHNYDHSHLPTSGSCLHGSSWAPAASHCTLDDINPGAESVNMVVMSAVMVKNYTLCNPQLETLW